jgi:hypothetical protein
LQSATGVAIFVMSIFCPIGRPGRCRERAGQNFVDTHG